MSHFLRTLGEFSIDGKSLSGTVRALLLVYLSVEPERNMLSIGKDLYENSLDEVKTLREHLRNIEKDLEELGIAFKFKTKHRVIEMDTIDSDYLRLKDACRRRDFEAMKTYAIGKFLDGLEGASRVNKKMRTWIENKDNDRVMWIWEAYLDREANPTLNVESIEEAFLSAGSVPNTQSKQFIQLYDLLANYGRLDGSIAGRMAQAIKSSGQSLGDYVSALKQTTGYKNESDFVPQTIQPKGPFVALPGTAQSPEAIVPQVTVDGSLEAKRSKSKRKWVWRVGIGLVLIVGLWLLLGGFSSYLNTRGTMLLEAGEHSRALRYLQVSQSINRLGFQKATVTYNLANALESLGRYDEAKAYYQEAIRLDSNFPAPYNNLSRLLIAKEKNPQEALAWLDRAYELVEGDASLAEVKGVILKNRAWARYELGSYQAAQRDIEQALSLSPTMAAAYCLAALLSEARGEEGLEHWENCVAYDVGETMVEATWRTLAQERLKP
jgi:tetratricopeptide (TPR) repeat protein